MADQPPVVDNAVEIDSTKQKKAWSTPRIEDGDTTVLTGANGTSGVEGTTFLKPGS